MLFINNPFSVCEAAFCNRDDPCVSELRQKVDELVDLYETIKHEPTDRNQALESTLGVSEKFWDELGGVNDTLKELQEQLAEQDKPALQPAAIREQQEILEVGLAACLRGQGWINLDYWVLYM